jgi:hypothetical protein
MTLPTDRDARLSILESNLVRTIFYACHSHFARSVTMTLIPLIDRTGAVRAWADRSTGWISNFNG